MKSTLADDTREELHFRRIDIRGFRRADGLFELEAQLVDRKPKVFTPRSGGRTVPAHDPTHDLGVRLVFDDMLQVRDVQSFSSAVPYPECHGGGEELRRLIGVRMVSGWRREVALRVRHSHACAHMRELLGPMATVANQTLSELARHRPEPLDPTGRPRKIDSCHAYRADRVIVRRKWPEFHRPPPP
ncbi:DUF2889 domain-containing protein [Verticiella sediminum]|uniref:DUF2889 domain-containing protein n=1 Tax=Verticiella sediminum TaxID=1247510 RepID=A0A556AV19_9BURK|nr:DUF2889 domain-containing protein [Verticiella sediminum]TSH96740.1 DUF2889 domain-containing protein [Verticiella sediminum]